MAKKAAAKPPAKAAKGAKSAKTASSGNKRMTKSAIYSELAEKTGLKKQQVQGFFDALFDLIKREVSKGGPGEFVLPPGLVKIRRKTQPARPAREGTDPRTGERRMFPAKPAKEVVKVLPLKTLKDLAPKS